MGTMNYEALLKERRSEHDKIAMHHQGRRLEEIARNLETMHDLALAQERATESPLDAAPQGPASGEAETYGASSAPITPDSSGDRKPE